MVDLRTSPKPSVKYTSRQAHAVMLYIYFSLAIHSEPSFGLRMQLPKVSSLISSQEQTLKHRIDSPMPPESLNARQC